MNDDLLLSDLIDRYTYLSKKYADLALELAPKLEQFGKYKNELYFIIGEMEKRGIKPEEPENMKKMIEEELKKRVPIPEGGQ